MISPLFAVIKFIDSITRNVIRINDRVEYHPIVRRLLWLSVPIKASAVWEVLPCLKLTRTQWPAEVRFAVSKLNNKIAASGVAYDVYDFFEPPPFTRHWLLLLTHNPASSRVHR
jgi:hypothetical protein